MARYFENPEIEAQLSWAEVIIFDMNGLIVDDEPVQLAAVNEVISSYHPALSELDWITQCVGRKPIEYLREMLTGERWNDNALQAISDAKEVAYERMIRHQVRELVRPGFLDFFQYLAQSPLHQIALATSTGRRGMETILGSPGLDIESAFDFTICGDEVTKAKPDPEIYLKAKAAFSDKENFLVFEDSSFGLKSAVNADCQCIAVPNEFTKQQELTQARMIMKDFTVSTALL